MEKIVLASASCYNQLYYLNPEYNELPTDIRNQLRYICVPLAEKLHGLFTIGLYADGSVYIESKGDEVDVDFDEIGSKLEIKKLEQEYEAFFKALQIWYVVYKTPEGEKIKQEIIKAKTKQEQ